MLKQYMRVNILLPIKPETMKVFRNIVTRLCRDFGGLTYIKAHIPSEVEGVCIDGETGDLIKDRHISLWIDVDSSNGINVEEYFSSFKKQYEKLLKENEIWIMSQNALRVA